MMKLYILKNKEGITEVTLENKEKLHATIHHLRQLQRKGGRQVDNRILEEYGLAKEEDSEENHTDKVPPGVTPLSYGRK